MVLEAVGSIAIEAIPSFPPAEALTDGIGRALAYLATERVYAPQTTIHGGEAPVVLTVQEDAGHGLLPVEVEITTPEKGYSRRITAALGIKETEPRVWDEEGDVVRSVRIARIRDRSEARVGEARVVREKIYEKIGGFSSVRPQS